MQSEKRKKKLPKIIKRNKVENFPPYFFPKILDVIRLIF